MYERDLASGRSYNISTVVSALFRDAKLPDLIAQSPGILDERQLAMSASSGRSSAERQLDLPSDDNYIAPSRAA